MLDKVSKLTLFAVLAAAQDGNPPADPISDHLRYEIAAAQRDYLIAKLQFDQAAAQLRGKLESAQK
jgi:hypothetical protein